MRYRHSAVPMPRPDLTHFDSALHRKLCNLLQGCYQEPEYWRPDSPPSLWDFCRVYGAELRKRKSTIDACAKLIRETRVAPAEAFVTTDKAQLLRNLGDLGRWTQAWSTLAQQLIEAAAEHHGLLGVPLATEEGADETEARARTEATPEPIIVPWLGSFITLRNLRQAIAHSEAYDIPPRWCASFSDIIEEHFREDDLTTYPVVQAMLQELLNSWQSLSRSVWHRLHDPTRIKFTMIVNRLSFIPPYMANQLITACFSPPHVPSPRHFGLFSSLSCIPPHFNASVATQLGIDLSEAAAHPAGEGTEDQVTDDSGDDDVKLSPGDDATTAVTPHPEQREAAATSGSMPLISAPAPDPSAETQPKDYTWIRPVYKLVAAQLREIASVNATVETGPLAEANLRRALIAQLTLTQIRLATYQGFVAQRQALGNPRSTTRDISHFRLALSLNHIATVADVEAIEQQLGQLAEFREWLQTAPIDTIMAMHRGDEGIEAEAQYTNWQMIFGRVSELNLYRVEPCEAHEAERGALRTILHQHNRNTEQGRANPLHGVPIGTPPPPVKLTRIQREDPAYQTFWHNFWQADDDPSLSVTPGAISTDNGNLYLRYDDANGGTYVVECVVRRTSVTGLLEAYANPGAAAEATQRSIFQTTASSLLERARMSQRAGQQMAAALKAARLRRLERRHTETGTELHLPSTMGASLLAHDHGAGPGGGSISTGAADDDDDTLARSQAKQHGGGGHGERKSGQPPSQGAASSDDAAAQAKPG